MAKVQKKALIFVFLLVLTVLPLIVQIPEVKAEESENVVFSRFNETNALKYSPIEPFIVSFSTNFTYVTSFGNYSISKIDGAMSFRERAGTLLSPSSVFNIQYDKAGSWEDLNYTNPQFSVTTSNQILFQRTILNNSQVWGNFQTTIAFFKLDPPKISAIFNKNVAFTTRIVWKTTVPQGWKYLVEGESVIDFQIGITRNVDRVTVINTTTVANSKLRIVADWQDFGVSTVELKGSTIRVLFPPNQNKIDPTLLEYYNSGDNSDASFYGIYWEAQTFISVGQHNITSVKLKMRRVGSPGTLTVGIRATSEGLPTGSDLTSGTINANTFTSDYPGQWYEITLTSYQLSSNTKYAIVCRATSGNLVNKVVWRAESGGTYESGSDCVSLDSGVSWIALSSYDLMFEEWGIGYVLYLRSLDWNGNVLAGVTIYSNTTSKTSNSTGWVRFAGYSLNEKVNVKVNWQDIWVNGTFSVTMTTDKTIDVKCRVINDLGIEVDGSGVTSSTIVSYSNEELIFSVSGSGSVLIKIRYDSLTPYYVSFDGVIKNEGEGWTKTSTIVTISDTLSTRNYILSFHPFSITGTGGGAVSPKLEPIEEAIEVVKKAFIKIASSWVSLAILSLLLLGMIGSYIYDETSLVWKLFLGTFIILSMNFIAVYVLIPQQLMPIDLSMIEPFLWKPPSLELQTFPLTTQITIQILTMLMIIVSVMFSVGALIYREE